MAEKLTGLLSTPEMPSEPGDAGEIAALAAALAQNPQDVSELRSDPSADPSARAIGAEIVADALANVIEHSGEIIKLRARRAIEAVLMAHSQPLWDAWPESRRIVEIMARRFGVEPEVTIIKFPQPQKDSENGAS